MARFRARTRLPLPYPIPNPNQVDADQFENLVGHGRDAPNQHPHLPAPQRGGGVTALTKGAKNLFKKKGGDETVLGGDTALGITQSSEFRVITSKTTANPGHHAGGPGLI